MTILPPWEEGLSAGNFEDDEVDRQNEGHGRHGSLWLSISWGSAASSPFLIVYSSLMQSNWVIFE